MIKPENEEKVVFLVKKNAQSKKGARKGARHKGTKARQKSRARGNAKTERKGEHGLVWIGLGILLLVGILAFLFLRQPQYPVKTTEQAAIDAFRSLGVSEIIIKDLARDFASGNYTLKELKKSYPGFEAEIDAANKQLGVTQKQVLVTVNGEPITRADLDLQLSLLPPQYRKLLSDQEVLQEMVDERLLVLEAKRRGIHPSEEEVEQAYQEMLNKSGLTPEQLEENLASFGMTNDDLRAMLRRQLQINALFNETVNQNITPSREEVEEYYKEHKDLFMTKDQVTVKHILIATQGIRSPEEARKRAEEVLARYKKGEDFCALVKEYSDDPGRKDACGEYTFGRGVMVPEFENASFEMQPGETRIVETTFGQHVILKVNETPAHLLSFEEAEPKIVTLLASQKRAAAYNTFITALRESANITYTKAANMTVETLPAAGAMVSPEPAQDASEGTLQDVNVSVTSSGGENASESVSGVNESGAETNGTERTGTERKNVSEASSQISVTVGSRAEGEITGDAGVTDALRSCLSTRDVRLYTASWAPVSLDQASQYGDAVTVLACDGADAKACAADGVDAYPSWKIHGKLYEGALSPARLASLTGC